MGIVARFANEQNAKMLRNGFLGAQVGITVDSATDASDVVVTHEWGDLAVSAVDSNVVTLTFANADTSLTPLVVAQVVADSAGFTSGGVNDQRFCRVAEAGPTSCAVALFDGNGTSSGTFNLMIAGHLRADSKTS